jgi:4'-phosphopantetheinyl transferase
LQQESSPGHLIDESSGNETGFIDVWRVDLSKSKLDELRSILSEDEIQRADKFVFDKDRNTFSRSRCCLRLILADCLQCEPEEIEFSFNEHGRPEISSPTLNSFNFNLTHSGDMALIAVSRGRRVGIDLNYLGQARDWQPIAKRSFSMAEQRALFLLPETDREKVFYQIWGQKEAYTKALGTGFSYGFQNFTVIVDPGGATGLLVEDKRPLAIGEWAIACIDVGEQWVAALAYDGLASHPSSPEIRQWEFGYDK